MDRGAHFLCILVTSMSSMVMSIKDFYTFFKGSYLPAVVLQLNCSSCLFTLDIGPIFRYESLQIFLLILWVAFLLTAEESVHPSLGNFRNLAKIIWPHLCQFIQDSLLKRFIALSAYFVAGRIPF